MDTTEAIVANASYHTRLLGITAELEYIPSARRQQASYVKDLDKGITKADKQVNELAQKTKKERKEYQALRDSTARRFAHLVVGQKQKFEAKASKEERCVPSQRLNGAFFVNVGWQRICRSIGA